MNSENFRDALQMLVELIRLPSPSGQEESTASIIEDYLDKKRIATQRVYHNVLARNRHWDPAKPIVVLNSHHDTVQPVESWTKDPYGASIEGVRLYGLGSNDAGASLVALIQAFVHFHPVKDLPFNLLLIASAEEENFGPRGISSVLEQLEEEIFLAIIGEPTSLQMAIAEKGLMVIDGVSIGKSGHAAYQNGQNAIYGAMQDIERIANLKFDRVSEFLGNTIAQVTQVQAGSQHNVIPDNCRFVIDVRINELYKLPEVLGILRNQCQSQLEPRSMKWKASGIPRDHLIVQCSRDLSIPLYGSGTLSDQVHFNCPSIKIGCGDSLRSHQADEYIELQELRDGLQLYVNLLQQLKIRML